MAAAAAAAAVVVVNRMYKSDCTDG